MTAAFSQTPPTSALARPFLDADVLFIDGTLVRKRLRPLKLPGHRKQVQCQKRLKLVPQYNMQKQKSSRLITHKLDREKPAVMPSMVTPMKHVTPLASITLPT